MVAEVEAEPLAREDTEAEALLAAEGLTLGVPVPVAHSVRVPEAVPLAAAEGVAEAEERSEMLLVMSPVREGVG